MMNMMMLMTILMNISYNDISTMKMVMYMINTTTAKQVWEHIQSTINMELTKRPVSLGVRQTRTCGAWTPHTSVSFKGHPPMYIHFVLALVLLVRLFVLLRILMMFWVMYWYCSNVATYVPEWASHVERALSGMRAKRLQTRTDLMSESEEILVELLRTTCDQIIA